MTDLSGDDLRRMIDELRGQLARMPTRPPRPTRPPATIALEER
jgi:hypothetical protein